MRRLIKIKVESLESFTDELVQMKHFFKTDDTVKQPAALLKHLVCFKDTFPDAVVALRI